MGPYPLRHARLTVGTVYRNKGGGSFEVLEAISRDHYRVRNISSGWTCTAHIITQYPDESIEWDYSTGGKFEK